MSDRTMPIDPGPVPAITLGQARDAATHIVRHTEDPDDARQIMAALGIWDGVAVVTPPPLFGGRVILNPKRVRL